ncbi:EAL domain-containing protein [Marinobacteraceae bacterium S3BR75-40.1]
MGSYRSDKTVGRSRKVLGKGLAAPLILLAAVLGLAWVFSASLELTATALLWVVLMAAVFAGWGRQPGLRLQWQTSGTGESGAGAALVTNAPVCSEPTGEPRGPLAATLAPRPPVLNGHSIGVVEYRAEHGLWILSPQAAVILGIEPARTSSVIHTTTPALLQRMSEASTRQLRHMLAELADDPRLASAALDITDAAGGWGGIVLELEPAVEAGTVSPRWFGSVRAQGPEAGFPLALGDTPDAVHAFLNATPFPLTVVGRSGRLIAKNRAFREWSRGEQSQGPSLVGAPYAQALQARGFGEEETGRLLEALRREQVAGYHSGLYMRQTPSGYEIVQITAVETAIGQSIKWLITHHVQARKGVEWDNRQGVRPEYRFRQVISSEAPFEWVMSGPYTRCSDNFLSMFGCEPGEITNFDVWWLDRVDPADRPVVQKALEQSATQAQAIDVEIRMHDGDNRMAWFRCRASMENNPRRLVGTFVSVQREHELLERVEEKEKILNEFAENIPEVLFCHELTPSDRLTFVSPAYETIWGRSREELYENPLAWLDAVVPEDREEALARSQQVLEATGPVDINYRIRTPVGELKWIHSRVLCVRDGNGQPVRRIGVARDDSEKQRVHQQLFEAAHQDTLTQLPNRLAFSHRIAELMSPPDGSEPQPFSIAFIDLDRFKTVNDTLGHSCGDELLNKAAQRLDKVVQDEGMVARIGGDEFAMLLPQCSAVVDACCITEKVERAFRLPIRVDGEPIVTTASIGVAFFPRDGDDPGALLRAADMAMYRAKQLGRNRVEFYVPDSERAKRSHLRLESDLRDALERREFCLFLQAQYDTASQRIVGAEVLLRWDHPQHGLVSPADFIPLLEDTGLIVTVGQWILREACRLAAHWREALDQPDFRIAVNISPRQLIESDFYRLVRNALAAARLPGRCLELEITESSLMVDPKATERLLLRIRELGVRLAVDDFGTGYSNFAYLRQFVPSTLKIDRSFIRDCDTQEKALQLVKSIIGMAKVLDMEVVAEGVEREEQLFALAEAECDLVQGFLLARPISVNDFTTLLTRDVEEAEALFAVREYRKGRLRSVRKRST